MNSLHLTAGHGHGLLIGMGAAGAVLVLAVLLADWLTRR